MNFNSINRPEIAVITNHGYAGPEIPVGGAPDTGGQNYYVNTFVKKLEKQGYKITVFTRGGFPFFNDKKIRENSELFTQNIRYVYVPGGGDKFIPKEDIAVALDEQTEWLYDFINSEAQRKKCNPWEVYEFINTHYWDAGVMGISITEKWKNDIISELLRNIFDNIIDKKQLLKIHDERHSLAIGSSPCFFIGYLLMNKFEQKNTEINEQIKNAASCWTSIDENKSELNNYITDHAIEGLKNLEVSFEPDYKINVAALKIGEAILAKSEELNNRIKKSLDSVNKHIWTPHSLGEIKDYNFKNKSLDERRSLKFCERRNHERMISDRTKLIVSTSTTIARYLWTHYKVPVENTFYFPPCVDEEVFRPYSQQELSDTYEYLSQKSKISVKKLMEGKIIFETSRMDRTKRKDLLIEAFKKTVNDYDDTYLFIGGGPKEELFNELMEQINSCKDLKGRAFLTGPIPDKYIGTIFSAAYIYATASEMEGFGMSASQAAVAGTPIACSDLIPFCNFYISEHSEMFKNGDADDFAKAIKSLLDDKNKRDWFAKEARKKARVLDWENKTKEFLQIIKAKNI